MDDRFASLLDEIRGLAERLRRELPGFIDGLVGRADALGLRGGGSDPLHDLVELLAVADRLGPEAWPALAARIDTWVGLLLDGDARDAHPLVAQLESVLDKLVELASGTLIDGVGPGHGSLDDLLMPWLEKLSEACVDATAGRTPPPEKE